MDKLSDKFAALKNLPSGLARRIASKGDVSRETRGKSQAQATLPERVEKAKNSLAEAVKRSRAKKPEEYREKHRDYMRKKRAANKLRKAEK